MSCFGCSVLLKRKDLKQHATDAALEHLEIQAVALRQAQSSVTALAEAMPLVPSSSVNVSWTISNEILRTREACASPRSVNIFVKGIGTFTMGLTVSFSSTDVGISITHVGGCSSVPIPLAGSSVKIRGEYEHEFTSAIKAVHGQCGFFLLKFEDLDDHTNDDGALVVEADIHIFKERSVIALE